MQLSKRQGDGAPLWAHLQAEARATGHADPLLLAQPPAECMALWEAFTDMAASRPAGLTAGAIPHTEIESWQRLSGVALTPWEVDTLKAMDRAALAKLSENNAPKAPAPKGKR